MCSFRDREAEESSSDSNKRGCLVSGLGKEGRSPGIYAGGDDGPGSTCVGGGGAVDVESSWVVVLRVDEELRLRMVDIEGGRDNVGPSCSETAEE